jgi:uncharacterized membrane protein
MTELAAGNRSTGRARSRASDVSSSAAARHGLGSPPAWQLGLAFTLLAILYAAVSIQQYHRMDSYIFDLGFFESLIRDYVHLHLPQLPLTDTTVATLHFSPALALLAPVVAIWPTPITVLVLQALLVAAGVVPLMRVAGRGAMPWAVAISYGLAPGFGALFGFDFHEVALAVPLLAFSMAAMVRGDHRSAVLWALPLVLVKEDLGLTIVALGFVVFVRGSRRWGLAAMVFGVVASAVLLVWLPHVMQGNGSFADSYAPTGASDAWRVLGEGSSNKVRTVLFLLIPTGLLALRSPMLLLVTIPTFAWRFLSDRPTYWDPWYQYDAILVPIAVAAMIEGAFLFHGRVRQIGLAVAVAGTLLLVPQQAFAQVWQNGFWHTPSRTAAVDHVLDKIPDGAKVAASDDLGSRIALRVELYLVGDTYGYDGPPAPASEFDDVQWIAFDSEVAPAPVPAWRGFAQLINSGEFTVVAQADGVVVARRTSQHSK